MMTAATAEGEVRSLIDSWAGAMRAKDAEAVLGHYSAEVVAFTLAPPLCYVGLDREALAAWFDTWQDAALGYEMTQLKVMVSQGLALTHSLDWLGGTKVDGGETGVWFRRTFGLRQIDGRWLIVHEHESVPFYMDGSVRAAVDLRPA